MKRKQDSTSEYSETSSDEEEILYYSDTEIDYNTDVVVIFPYNSLNSKQKEQKKLAKKKKSKLDIQREKILNKIKNLDKNKEETLLNQILDSDFTLDKKAHLVSELENFTDKDKIKSYVKRVLKIPHKESEFRGVGDDIIVDLRKNLDDTVYGHIETKEEIIDFVTSKLSNPLNYKSQILALQGPPGIGKCHAKDTKILMYNGDYKMVQDIKIGDKIMGDDSTPRNVTNLGSGRDMLYLVEHTYSGKSYSVNKDHILCLKSDTGEIVEISLDSFLCLSEKTRNKYKGYSTVIEFPEMKLDMEPEEYFMDLNRGSLPVYYKINSSKIRKEVLRTIAYNYGFRDGDKFVILLTNNKLADDVMWLIDSLGYLCNLILINDIYYISINNSNKDILIVDRYFPHDCEEYISITSIGVGDYYGFTLDGNCRYIIDSFIVTHNTRFIRALGKTLNLPFNQISFGGLNDVSVLTGHDYTYIGSKPGKIYDTLAKSKCTNCIIYLDEIDKISSPESDKFIAINGVLTHLLDPEQNKEFHDNYLGDITLDLSKVFFIVSFNNYANIDPVVLNRLKIIEIKETSVVDKVQIVKKFTLPDICKNIGIELDSIEIDDDTIKYIISVKTKSDKGMRSINKNIFTLISKINTLLHIENIPKEKKDIIVKGFSYEKINISKYKKNNLITINREIVDIIFKQIDTPIYQHMYI